MLKLVNKFSSSYFKNVSESYGRYIHFANCSSEPSAPIMKTELPGPKSLELMKTMSSIQSTNNMRFVADYENSFGNFITDADGNQMLDLFCQISSLPLGYNHPNIVKAAQSKEYMTASVNRPALGMFPPKDYFASLKNSLMKVAPPGLHHVQTMMCGSCSIENALKATFIRYMTKQRNGRELSESELKSAMLNAEPGCPNISILSFNGGFHGRTLGSLSLTRSKAVHKVDIPLYQWPSVDFPRYKYSLEDHIGYNSQQDVKCLENVERTIDQWRSKSPICGIIVEPILAEGGDIHGSNDFFKGLRDICSKYDITFIVDEVQTGGGPTGTFWAHEQWGLNNPPDIVTFSKKMLIGGYYTSAEYLPEIPYRIFNTWVGEPSKMLLLEATIQTIQNENLLKSTATTGEYLLSGLSKLQKGYPKHLSNVRGRGTFCAFDCATTQQRNQLVSQLGNLGVVVGGSGEVSVRFRPALILQKHHVDVFIDKLQVALASLA